MATAVERSPPAVRRENGSPEHLDLVSVGSHVILEDLDDAVREEYDLVGSAESNPAEGRISDLSPVGRAVIGHRTGDVVEARAPCGARHLRIAEVHQALRPFRDRPQCRR